MSNCEQVIPFFVDLQCQSEKGRINAIAFVSQEKAAVVLNDPDPSSVLSDPAFWTDEDYEASILLHKNVSGNYAGADTERAGKGNQQTTLSGKNHTVTIRIESVKHNDDYWNKLNISSNYYLAFVADDYNILFFSTTACGISGNLILEDNLESILEWEATVKWSDIALPITSDVPIGIFQ